MTRWPNPVFASVFVLTTLASTAALGYAYDYSGERESNLLECDRHHWNGRTTEAEACFGRLLQTGTALQKAESAWALGDRREANRLFAEAAAADPSNPQVRTRWGYLFMDTWQYADAVQLFQEVIAEHPDYRPAHIGMAAAGTSQFTAGGHDALFAILENNLENTEALLILAKLYLEIRDTDGAEVYLDTAESLIGDSLPPLQLYALRAASAYLDRQDIQPWVDRTLALNPVDGDIFVELAYFAEVTYQYRDAANFLRQGTRVEPTNWRARAQLGLALSKLDQVDEARQHLEAAYRSDPFNTDTVNTLRLFDTFSDYLVIERNIPFEFRGEAQRAAVRIRLHRNEAAVLSTYVEQMISQALPIFAERYDFLPVEPISVELYPHHADFAVRTLGEPMIGPLGIAFGYLFAMNSPSAKPAGEFHWGSVFWHELSHVFTLEASGGRVPRWLSEGLSTFEEWNSGPLAHYQIPSYVFQAIQERRMLSVRDLDSGFLRPTYETQLIVSYNQAGLVCQYIAERWSQEVFGKMLQAYREGQDIEQVFSSVLEVNTFAFDRDFQRWVDETFASPLGNLEAWLKYNEQAQAAAAYENWPGVVDAANNALILYPDYTGGDSAFMPLARAYRELGEDENELRTLRNYFQRGGYEPEALQRLIAMLEQMNESDEAHEVRLALRWISPLREDLHRALAEDYSRRGQTDDALVEYQMLLDLGVREIASVHLGIAKLHHQTGRAELARRHTLLALDSAPHYREAQQFLFDIMQQD